MPRPRPDASHALTRSRAGARRQSVGHFVLVIEVGDADFYDSLRAHGVRFADERAIDAESAHADRAELGFALAKVRVEGKVDIGKAGHVAARMAAGVDGRALDIAEVADVVGRPIGSLDDR